MHVDIVITGTERPHQIGSSVNLTCSSDLLVQTIQWLNSSDNSSLLLNNTREQQLILPIVEIRTLANHTYTCEMVLQLSDETEVNLTKTIVLGIDGNF